MKFSKLKKTVALLVCLTCMLSAMPLNVFATEEGQKTSGGASVNTQYGVGTQLSDQEKRNATLEGIRDGLGGSSKNSSLEEIEQLAISQGWIDSNGNLTDNAPEGTKESVFNAIEAAKDEKLYTTGDAKGAANFVAQDYENKTGEKLSEEALTNLEFVYSNSVYTDVDEQDAQWANANGQKIAFQIAVSPIVANMMTRAGYDDPVKFAQDLAAGKIDPTVAQDWEEWKKVNDVAANSNNGAGTHAKDDFMRDYFDKYPPASKNEWFTKYFNYILIQGQMIESLGGGYTLSVDDEGSLVFTSTDPGAAYRIFTISKYDMQINYTGFRAEYYRLYGENLSDEEIFKMITDYLQETKIIEEITSVVVDHDSYKEVLAYMNEAYTYIKEVTFTLSRADNKEIRHNEIPTITPQSFKENFIRFKDGNYYGTNVEMELKASGMSEAEQDLFKDLFEQPVFANDTHRRRATAYLYAYFCLEEWLCEVTGHPLEPSDTYLQFSQGTKIGRGQDAGWKVNGSRMTLTIDFYKSFVELSKVTGINVNDIIRNYMSDYTPSKWSQNGASAATSLDDIKISFTTHSGEIINNDTDYFGKNGRSTYTFGKGEVIGYVGFFDSNEESLPSFVSTKIKSYYSNNLSTIARELQEPTASVPQPGGIGRAYVAGQEPSSSAYWVSKEGKYLGTVHSETAFSKYFNGQRINTKMFKLGDETGTYGYVPFLVTERPEISSAFNVQVDAIEYTLFMPAQYTESRYSGETLIHPSWIYFSHREVPGMVKTITTTQDIVYLDTFNDAIENRHWGEEEGRYVKEFEKLSFKDPGYFLFFYGDLAGIEPVATQLDNAWNNIVQKNLRSDMLEYYSGYTYRKLNENGDGSFKNTDRLGAFPEFKQEPKKEMKEFLQVIEKEKHFNENIELQEKLKQYNFKYAVVENEEKGESYCYAIFGAALNYIETENFTDPHLCEGKINCRTVIDANGNKTETSDPAHQGHCKSCCKGNTYADPCPECTIYWDSRHICSKNDPNDLEPPHSHDDAKCCGYKVAYIKENYMPTVTFNDTHGNVVINSDYNKSNGIAQRIIGISDLGLNAMNGGVKTDHHRWAWASTFEAYPEGNGNDILDPIPPIDPTNPPSGGNPGSGGGGGGNPPNPGVTKPYPWPTPITPPGGLKLFAHIGKTIETFITV